MTTSLKFAITSIVICSLLVFSVNSNAQKITLEIESDRRALKPGENDLELSYIIKNNSSESITEVKFRSEITSWKDKSVVSAFSPEVYTLDPNANNILDPGESWVYKINHSLMSEQAKSFALSGAVIARSDNGNQYEASDAQMLLTYGVNMDISIYPECYNETTTTEFEVSMATRLLIDEDAAKSPGIVILLVDGEEVEIQLPATRWEARDLVLTVDQLNNGLAFDPFNLPAGVDLDVLCDQGGTDTGRNTNNILDECETIETVKFPCVEFGEDDILCEYPDWVFCYSFPVPEFGDDLWQLLLNGVTAADNFSIWRAVESPPESGNFGPFEEITGEVVAGSEENEPICLIVAPVALAKFSVAKKGSTAELTWSTLSETNNSHFDIMRSSDGLNFEKIGTVNGNRTTTDLTQYRFVDDRPLVGKNYYSLWQQDFDGATEKLPVREIEFEYSGGGKSIITPNPFSDILTIKSDTFLDAMQLIMFDKHGKVVVDQMVNQNKAIQMNDVPNGVYILKLYDRFGMLMDTHQVIKAN